MTFRRTALAEQMAQQLLRPSFLDTSLRSGLFLSGQRRVGKTTFLATDLIPALEALGAIVVYVDLWSQPQVRGAVGDARSSPLEGEDLIVEGRVLGMPEQGEGRVRFEFTVMRGQDAAEVLDGRRLRLAWYRSEVVPAPGSEWRLAVRLKRPRGTVNPGGFDYERHAGTTRIERCSI